MIIVHVHVLVKTEMIEAFRQACIENARNSIREEGIARFDIIQQQDNPERFILVEVYRNSDANKKHKETAHYQKWREEVANMMAEERYSIKYDNVFPDDEGW
jgi:autoinducer 2-degrading protein